MNHSRVACGFSGMQNYAMDNMIKFTKNLDLLPEPLDYSVGTTPHVISEQRGGAYGKWIFDSPGQAGEAFRQFIKDCYQKNLLIQNSIGMFVGSRSQGEVCPKIASWLKNRS